MTGSEAGAGDGAGTGTRAAGDGGDLIGVDRHLERILATVRVLPPFTQGLLDAHGCALYEDITARFDLPSFDNSAMDGYAVRSADLTAATEADPVQLPVIGDLAAGPAEAVAIGPGMAVRIMTGAAVPTGADAVVPVERTDGGVARVLIRRAPEPGAHIRRRGEDANAGDVLLEGGTVLGARELALLAAAGYSHVPVRPRPRVVVVSTGSELREPGEALGDGLIHDANGYALSAAVREAGGIPYRVGIVPDDPTEFRRVMSDQLVRADLIVTSGGVSVGAFDIVKAELPRLGDVRFDRVAMQPGMPQGFGVLGDDATPIFTLPGNPVSAYVSFRVFVEPAIRAMSGASTPVRPTITATVSAGWTAPAGKRQYARVHYDGRTGEIAPVSGAGSHLVAGLARANALAVVPEEVTVVEVGDRLEVLPLG